jgi:hypothetical protein
LDLAITVFALLVLNLVGIASALSVKVIELVFVGFGADVRTNYRTVFLDVGFNSFVFPEHNARQQKYQNQCKRNSFIHMAPPEEELLARITCSLCTGQQNLLKLVIKLEFREGGICPAYLPRK